MGVGTNNLSEFNARFVLMKYALGRGVLKLQVLGDSKLVIDWILGAVQITNNALVNIGRLLKRISDTFQMISFKHIFREINVQAESLSKEPLVGSETFDIGRIHLWKSYPQKFSSFLWSLVAQVFGFRYCPLT